MLPFYHLTKARGLTSMSPRDRPQYGSLWSGGAGHAFCSAICRMDDRLAAGEYRIARAQARIGRQRALIQRGLEQIDRYLQRLTRAQQQLARDQQRRVQILATQEQAEHDPDPGES
jgi:hypothetical protein